MTKDFGRDWSNEPPIETDVPIDPNQAFNTQPPRNWRLSDSARHALVNGIRSETPSSSETNLGTSNPVDELDAMQAQIDNGEGVPMIKTAIELVRAGKLASARKYILNDSDKLHSYPPELIAKLEEVLGIEIWPKFPWQQSIVLSYFGSNFIPCSPPK